MMILRFRSTRVADSFGPMRVLFLCSESIFKHQDFFLLHFISSKKCLFISVHCLYCSKTGWANQQSSATSVVEVKTDEFPVDANEKILRVNAMMNQLTGTSLTTMIGQVDLMAQQALLAAGPAGALGIMPAAQLASVADAALDMALGVTPIVMGSATVAIAAPVVDAKVVGRAENPAQNILVHNMFDKDEETEKGWEEDIRLDFEEECAQYGKIERVVVMSDDPGGMIYASFDSVEGAMKCAKSVAGRWFDKRQLCSCRVC